MPDRKIRDFFAGWAHRRFAVMTISATTRTVTVAERPDLAAGVFEVLASRWPAYMLAGEPAHGVDLIELLGAGAPQHQILLLDDDDQVLGAGLSLLIEWDQTVDGLPAGWDAVVAGSAQLLAAGRAPSMVSALSVTLVPQASGQGLATPIIQAMKAAAVAAGAPGMLVPVRPVFKHRYPLIPMAGYAQWRNPSGGPFDPWLATHVAMGARQLKVVEQSLTVTGTVEQWQDWTGLAMPGSGDYVIAGGAVPLSIDRDADRGVYSEPNIWVHHPAD